jgi:chaperonin GroES
MNSPIKPLADRVVAVLEEAQTKTASGLYMPETAKEKPVIAKILAVGPKVKDLKVGDRIVYKKYAASMVELKIDNKDYFVLDEEDVLGTL